MNIISSYPVEGFWSVWSTLGVSVCWSLPIALQKAYELYSLGKAPYAVGHFNSNARLDAHDIVTAWRELGWLN